MEYSSAMQTRPPGVYPVENSQTLQSLGSGLSIFLSCSPFHSPECSWGPGAQGIV